MTIREFLKKCSEREKQEIADLMMGTTSIWSNDACMGYCIETMKRCEIEEDTIGKIVRSMYYVFDSISVEEAEQVFRDF